MSGPNMPLVPKPPYQLHTTVCPSHSKRHSHCLPDEPCPTRVNFRWCFPSLPANPSCFVCLTCVFCIHLRPFAARTCGRRPRVPSRFRGIMVCTDGAPSPMYHTTSGVACPWLGVYTPRAGSSAALCREHLVHTVPILLPRR